MAGASSFLLAALSQLPRRCLLPPLPADEEAARAARPETALAFALEAARCAHERGAPAPAALQPLFTQALAALIRAALEPARGDPGFQALVLRSGDAQVQEHVRLAAEATVDERALRSTVDAVAHPGKLRGLPDADLRARLERLHRLAQEADWAGLRSAVEAWRADAGPEGSGAAPHGGGAARWEDGGPSLRPGGGEDGNPCAFGATLAALAAHPALVRRERAQVLAALTSVQRYRSLCAAGGPRSGSEAAAAQGRASARAGLDAEAETVAAFEILAQALVDRTGLQLRVVRGLRLPRGFPGVGGNKAKEEWDVALLQCADSAADVLLLAEVKASPAAATSDLARLLRGLQRLALAEPGIDYSLPAAEGEVRLHGATLRSLAPNGFELPERVIYCCAGAPETPPPVLAAASKAVLLAEPASLAWALDYAAGAAPAPDRLAPIWQALPVAPRLRATLYQYATSQAARTAMLHPADLRTALAVPG